MTGFAAVRERDAQRDEERDRSGLEHAQARRRPCGHGPEQAHAGARQSDDAGETR